VTTKPQKVEHQCDLTPGQFYDTVTGEERGLVKRAFREPLAQFAKDDKETFVEALVFLDLHRRREPDPKARAHAMTIKELQDYFADDEDEEADDSGEG